MNGSEVEILTVATTIQDAYLENRVLGSSPIELLRLLYGGAIDAVRAARARLAGGDIAARSRAISKAQAILHELDCALNREQGGELAARLGPLYAYMQTLLTHANLQQSDQPLAEVERLLTTLREGWDGIEEGPLALAS